MSLPAKDSSLPGSGDHRQGNKLPVSIQECEREEKVTAAPHIQGTPHPVAPRCSVTLGGTRAVTKAVDASLSIALALGKSRREWKVRKR